MATLHLPHTTTAVPSALKKRPSARAQRFTATRADYASLDEDYLLENDAQAAGLGQSQSRQAQVWLGAGMFAVSAAVLFLAFIPKFMMLVLLIGGITFLASLIGVVYARAGKFGFGVACVVSLLAIGLASSVTVVLGWFNNVLGFFA